MTWSYPGEPGNPGRRERRLSLRARAFVTARRDAENWRAGPCQGVYPGIDLLYYGNQRQFEYDFVVSPGADPGRIGLEVEGTSGLELDAASELVLHTGAGDVVEHAPVLYQETALGRRPVSGSFVLEGPGRVGFRVGAYDRGLHPVGGVRPVAAGLEPAEETCSRRSSACGVAETPQAKDLRLQSGLPLPDRE